MPRMWKSRELIRLLSKKHSARIISQKGFHLKLRVTGSNGVTSTATIPVRKGRDVTRTSLHCIERDLAPSLGEGWLRREG